MATTTRRQRELARARWERQQQRRQEGKRKSRQRQKILAAAVSVALIATLAVFVTDWVGGDEEPEETLDASGAPVLCQYNPVEGVDTGGKVAALPPSTAAVTGTYTATITTNQGEIVMDLEPAAAPCTVNSFVHLAQSGFYDATTCHRMLVDAGQNILQCGDPTATSQGGPGYQFADENLDGAAYTAGVVAMANSGANTNGSQFFMVYSDSGFDPNYTPFGRITSGLDILEQIAAGGVTGENNDIPVTEVEIQSVTITSA